MCQSALGDVYRCRLDNGELLYTDLGCLEADLEQRYKDSGQLVKRSTPRLKLHNRVEHAAKPALKTSSQRAVTDRGAAATPEHIEASVRHNGFINYDHYERSLNNCQLLQDQSDSWLNNRCDEALAVAKLEKRNNGTQPTEVNVTTRGAVDLSRYQYLDTNRSSTVRGVWFHEEKTHLVVKVNAAYYAYCGVNRPVVMQLILSPSISAYLHSHIKGFYDC